MAEESKPKKAKPWHIAANIVSGLLLLCLLLVASDVIYLKAAYSEAFFVNGMSMYPTLNATGKRYENGAYRALRWDDASNLAGDIVDYGYARMGSKGDWRASLKRLDIVVAYFAEDYAADGSLKEGASPKIKRLIGLPGESVRFDVVSRFEEGGKLYERVGNSASAQVSSYDSSYNPAWGKTTILFEGKEEILPALYGPEDFPAIGEKSYPNAALPGDLLTKTFALGDDEYLLFGDNRGGTAFSLDSRVKGAVKSEMIVGKACLLTGQRKLVEDGGAIKTQFCWESLRLPWQYRKLGED